jgi:glutaminyl-peptide cyclotransferase
VAGARSLLHIVALLGVSVALAASGCKRSAPAGSTTPADGTSAEAEPGTSGEPATGPGSAKKAPRVAVSTAPPPKELWKEFSGKHAMDHTTRQVEIGPRPAGSEGIESARKLITEALTKTGWEVERQEFSEQTPRGVIKFVNLIGRFSADGSRPVARDTQRAILCSHFDTKRYSTIRFVGASDGASSTGALMELARVLALDPKMAAQVELVFFDGEEALEQFTETDGLYGSRFYARSLRTAGRVKQFQFGILWDMIGDRDLTITLSPDSPPEITRDLLASADALGLRQHFTYHTTAIWDDHVPLNRERIPTVNIIDFDYLYWHTADDTLDKVSPESMQKVGAVTLHLLQQKLRGR